MAFKVGELDYLYECIEHGIRYVSTEPGKGATQVEAYIRWDKVETALVLLGASDAMVKDLRPPANKKAPDVD
jgi:hypothetical protein